MRWSNTPCKIEFSVQVIAFQWFLRLPMTALVKSSLFYQTLKVRRKESVKKPYGHLSQLLPIAILTVTVIGVNLNLAINYNTK